MDLLLVLTATAMHDVMALTSLVNAYMNIHRHRMMISLLLLTLDLLDIYKYCRLLN